MRPRSITFGWLLVAIFAAESFGVQADDVASQEPSRPAADDANDFGPIESARQLFSALGMTDDEFRQFHDGSALPADASEPLLQTLHAFSQFPAAKIHRWTKHDVEPTQLQANPEKYRGELIHLSGQLNRVTPVEIPAKLAERFEVSSLYRCDIDFGRRGRAVLLTQVVPKGWQIDAPLDEPVSFDGVFLQTSASSNDEPPELVFAAQRIAWHPQTPLGKLGMDVGLLDSGTQNRAISGAEADAFYQMLAAAGRANLSDLLAATYGQQWTVIPGASDQPQLAEALAKLKREKPGVRFYFAGEPKKYIGELMAFEGQVYRCVEVKIANRELAQRLGFEHYYDLQVFIDLDYRLNLGTPKPGADVNDNADQERRSIPTEVTTYPIAACVRQLPPGFPTGEKLKERVRVPGYFFKQWTYRSEAAAKLHPLRPERSPLIIGPGVEWLSQPKPADTRFQTIVGVAFVVLLTVLCFVLWRTNRRDRKFREEMLSRNRATASLNSLDDSAVESPVNRQETH